jgi:hypothetical protein
MLSFSDGLSPGDRERAKGVAKFWNDYDVCGDPGGTTREVLEGLKQEVTDCLYKKPPDICGAERRTVVAMMLIEGRDEF